ncbi:MAG: TetR/AcrR family transcriptional regulator [Gemmatimonadetes bacterium]|nr:TetR/AcrR family transcriptional regulator [Gemmatimonadota bacterium]
MSEPSASAFVQPPKQARSQRTLERIARAALELIAEQGVEATTVAQIVARAGSSIGSFYARFSGKDELMHYLEERVWSDARARWDNALANDTWKDLSLPDVVAGVVRLIINVEQMGGKAKQALAFSSHAAHGEPSPHHVFAAHLEAGASALLLDRRDQIGHPCPEDAVAIGYRTISAAAREFAFADGHRSSDDYATPSSGVDPETFHAELSLMFLSYLGTAPTPKGDSPEDVDFFEIWS